MFQDIQPPPADSLMEVGKLYRADDRSDKMDLGVGTYRDNGGQIKVMATVKEAEGWKLKSQIGKGYLGPAGDPLFCELLIAELLPNLEAMAEGRMATIQTPGGTGAYRLGLELAAHLSPGSRLIVGTPTWPNHIPTAEHCGIEHVAYPYYDAATGRVDFESLIAAANAARPRDLFLLHGCCHNPTGASLTRSQWLALRAVLAAKDLVPVVDLAYAGLARGIEADMEGTRLLLDALPQVIVAISCSKSFGLYSDRTGMLAVLAPNSRSARSCRLTAEALARMLWSNPPDHGAAVVRMILSDPTLRNAWYGELEEMRTRLLSVRTRLAAASIAGDIDIEGQDGLFTMLPLQAAQILALRREHAIYLDLSSRINIAGLNDNNIDRFIEACRHVILHPCIA
ncbi:MAG: aromatic amino acid transaminase [Sphingomonas sp.]|uniref:aromatic amino acid transaminase n=1 Tax=Sphingomonas sp. TaxID=28214 RepID=UPI002621B375|nr:aromatic amino acid transaminase [Sphingomonas sp.]MDK2770530.1 aromatic amino acid transaminase [Sphingomonas sp.]